MVRSLSWLVLLVSSACGRVSFHPVPDAAPAADATVDARVDARPVSPIGCADGEREMFLDPVTFPTIAGCAATWTDARDLRAATTGTPCGDDGEVCASPADACAVGWHICAHDGDVSELLVLTPTQCRSASGRWVAAADHCESYLSSTCTYASVGSAACSMGDGVDCTQPICCGDGCIRPECRNEVWLDATYVNRELGPGCAQTPASAQDGLLCCRA